MQDLKMQDLLGMRRAFVVRYKGNVTKDRLGPRQGSNERKVMGAGMGSGCGVQRRLASTCIVYAECIHYLLC